MDTETIRTIVGIVGNVISLGLFLSPIPTFLKIWKEKSVQDFKPDPYVATLLNCAMWSFYGLPFVHPDSILVITINGTGFFIELAFVAIFLAFSTWPNRKMIIIFLVVEAIFLAVVAFVTLNFFHTTKARSMIVGILCIIFTISMYLSPLTVMKMVIQTKSVKYMPLCLSVATFFNGIVWVIYALLKFDPYIVIPNGLGTFSALVQLVLYCTYYKTTKWDSDDDQKPHSEVQLSDAV
ncbi:bidirectional sugar transporter SWEET5 [Morus notabilis]|uniref:bidirectional sugar transporter SWEET5 n=1 Tax=Morus notabilis TaxID=981085 RepID=UPI000CED68B4|nr:bidirectional sugar transporter SWEET5 [Morus notabilis]